MLISKKIIRLLLIVLVIVLFMLIVHRYDLSRYLGIDGFNNYNHYLIDLEYSHPIEFIIIYFLAYVILIALCIPGTIVFDLIAGFVFGAVFGSIIVIISYLAGAVLNFFFVKYVFKDMLENKFHKFKHFIHGDNKKSLLMNLIGLRLVAVIPFWVINIAAALIGVSMIDFVISTFIGILPTSIIYAVIGDGVRDSVLAGNKLDSAILFNYKIWSPLIVLAIMLILPNIIKYLKKKHKVNS